MSTVTQNDAPAGGGIIATGSAAAQRRPGGRHRMARFRENALTRLVPQTLVLTGRILRRWSRDPATMVQSLIFPVGFLVALNIVLGDGIEQVTGHSALYGSVPLVAMVGATSGAIIGALGVMRERDDGLLSRLWVVPIHRGAGLLARLLADSMRIVAITLIVMGVGLILGFRFEQGLPAAVLWVFVPAMFGVVFSAFVITLALFSANAIVPQATEIICAILFFFSTGFVPLDQFPKWLQPAVEHQPVSYVIETMRGLSLEGPILHPLIGTLVWSLGGAALCAVPLAVGYRRASRHG